MNCIAGIGKQCQINYKWGAYTNGFVLAEGLDVFRLRAIATGGRGLPSGNLSFGKRILVGAESRKDKWDPFD
jgi:hypothetical protein